MESNISGPGGQDLYQPKREVSAAVSSYQIQYSNYHYSNTVSADQLNANPMFINK